MRRAALFLLLSAIAGCKLTETTLSPGERTIVVQSVLSLRHRDQFAVLEYSFNGDTAGRVKGGNRIPPAKPQLPIPGALVTITHEGTGACDGKVDTLLEVPPVGGAPSGVYAGVPCALAPGRRAKLKIVTADGRAVTAETVVPGIEGRTVSSGGRFARFQLDTLPLWRERDTLRIAFSANNGHGVEVEVRRAERHSDLALDIFNDSVGIAIPGTLVNPFDSAGEIIFRPGRYYLITAVLTDSNYFDFMRSISDPITGRGFLNHINGGIGVFGSVDVEQYMIRVVGDRHDPREGLYRITERGSNPNINLTLNLYLTDDTRFGPEPFSGFVTGVGQPVIVNRVPQTAIVNVSGDGSFGAAPGVAALNHDAFVYSFDVVAPQFRRYTLSGVRAAKDTFPVSLVITTQGGSTVLRSTLLGRQTSSPAPSNQAPLVPNARADSEASQAP
ncbi:MAG: hypothetical protein HY700_07575 [Gemmatimonadetes bacterium]|nr:hypothetical protein [Gemmatimonadota bacterium]